MPESINGNGKDKLYSGIFYFIESNLVPKCNSAKMVYGIYAQFYHVE